MRAFFFHKLQLITVLLLILDSYISWSTRFVSLKVCMKFSIFASVSLLLFLFNKKHGLFDFKMSQFQNLNLNQFQNLNNRKSAHTFATRPLIFKLQQEVLKFNDICVSWSSLKTGPETNFLNLENRSLEYVTFSQ